MFPVPVGFNLFELLRKNNIQYEKIFYIPRSGYYAVFFGQKSIIANTLEWLAASPKDQTQYLPPISRIGLCERSRRYFIEYDLTQLELENSKDYKKMASIRTVFKEFNLRLKLKWSLRYERFYIVNFIKK